MKRHRDENAYIKEPNSSNTYDKVKIIFKVVLGSAKQVNVYVLSN